MAIRELASNKENHRNMRPGQNAKDAAISLLERLVPGGSEGREGPFTSKSMWY